MRRKHEKEGESGVKGKWGWPRLFDRLTNQVTTDACHGQVAPVRACHQNTPKNRRKGRLEGLREGFWPELGTRSHVAVGLRRKGKGETRRSTGILIKADGIFEEEEPGTEYKIAQYDRLQ